MRFDPFRELSELDRMASQVVRGAARPAAAMDAYRRGDQFLVHLDLPGVRPDAIDLTVEQNVLTVTAERQRPYGEGDEVLVSERPLGRVQRQLFLGEQLDTESIEARYEDGVLTLRLPVAEQARPRKVPVQSNGSAPRQIAA